MYFWKHYDKYEESRWTKYLSLIGDFKGATFEWLNDIEYEDDSNEAYKYWSLIIVYSYLSLIFVT